MVCRRFWRPAAARTVRVRVVSDFSALQGRARILEWRESERFPISLRHWTSRSSSERLGQPHLCSQILRHSDRVPARRSSATEPWHACVLASCSASRSREPGRRLTAPRRVNHRAPRGPPGSKFSSSSTIRYRLHESFKRPANRIYYQKRLRN